MINTIEQKAEQINNDAFEAADYAIDAAEDAGYGFDRVQLEFHLDCLIEAGATFNHCDALEIAMNKSQDME